MGLITYNIENYQNFSKYYLACNRTHLIAGYTIILKAQDYFEEYTQLIKK